MEDNVLDLLCVICQHAYGEHYVTYRGDGGCSNVADDGYPCECQGFTTD